MFETNQRPQDMISWIQKSSLLGTFLGKQNFLYCENFEQKGPVGMAYLAAQNTISCHWLVWWVRWFPLINIDQGEFIWVIL